MNLKSIWSALEESFDILGGYGYPAMDKAAQELALEPDYFTWFAAVMLFEEVESFTVADYMRIFPYGQARRNKELLASAVQQGYLASDGKGGHRASELGWNTARRIYSAAGDSIASLQPLPDQPLQTLVNLLYRLTEASFGMSEPPEHFGLSHVRNERRVKITQLIEHVPRYIVELSRYRDDCYIATWSAHGVEGHAWDMLDVLSQSDALTFDDLHNKLSRRGVTEEVHAGDVKELVGRGWAEESSGLVKATEAGKQVRAEVEAETERLFFAPWSCLNESELEELSSLASQLRDGLKES